MNEDISKLTGKELYERERRVKRERDLIEAENRNKKIRDQEQAEFKQAILVAMASITSISKSLETISARMEGIELSLRK